LSRQIVVPYAAEILGYITISFDEQPLATVECIRMLFVAVFSPRPLSLNKYVTLGSDAMTTPSSLFATFSQALPLPQPPPQGSTEKDYSPRLIMPPKIPHVSHEKYCTAYEHLLLHPKKHPMFFPLINYDMGIEGNDDETDDKTLSAESWTSTHGSGWIQIVYDILARASPKEMSRVLNTGNKRQILRQFEPLVAAAMQKYLASQKPQIQQSILLLLTTLIKFEVEFSALDKDQTFFRHVINQVNSHKTSPLVALN